jgi:hypothetical protein
MTNKTEISRFSPVHTVLYSPDLRKEIILAADGRSILNFVQLNRTFAKLVFINKFWERLILRDFGPDALPDDKDFCYIAYVTHHLIVEQLLKPSGQALQLPTEEDLWQTIHKLTRIDSYHLIEAFRQRFHSDKTSIIHRIYAQLEDKGCRMDFERVINRLPDDILKIDLLIILGQSYLDSGANLDDEIQEDFTNGLRILAEVERIALLLIDPLLRSQRLAQLAEIHIRFRNFGPVNRLLEMAEEFTRFITDESKRNLVLSSITQSYVYADDLTRAERVALLISNKEAKEMLLKKIALGYKSGNLLNEAERVVLLIGGEKIRSQVLSEIVSSHLYRAHNLTEAIRVALLIPDRKERSGCLCCIALIYKDQHRVDEAQEVALLVPDDLWSSDFLSEAACLRPTHFQRLKSYVRSLDISSLQSPLAIIALATISLYQLTKWC